MSCEINFKETAVQSRSQRPNSGNHSAPPSPPLTETPDAHAVSGSLNISFLWAQVRVTSSCLSLQWLCTNSQSSYGNLLNQIFQLILSCPNATCRGWLVLHQHLACSQHSSLVQCVWPCALRRVSLSDKYSQGHPLAPSLQPAGAWQSPHNNSVLMVQLSQWGWAGGCGLKEPLAGGPGLRGWAPESGGSWGLGGGLLG